MKNGGNLFEKSRARYEFGIDPSLNLNDWQSWEEKICL